MYTHAQKHALTHLYVHAHSTHIYVHTHSHTHMHPLTHTQTCTCSDCSRSRLNKEDSMMASVNPADRNEGIRGIEALYNHHALLCPVLSCPILSCPILSCPILSYPVLSCPFVHPEHFRRLVFFEIPSRTP